MNLPHWSLEIITQKKMYLLILEIVSKPQQLPSLKLVISLTASCFLRCSTDVGSVEGLAYHRGWDTLYWTSYTTSTITRHTVDQSRSVAYNRNTVVTMSGEDHPRAFVLDECQE